MPDNAPLDGSKVTPVGRAGETDHDVTVPVTVGVRTDIALFTRSSTAPTGYDSAVGGAMISRDSPTESEPAMLVAVIVWTVGAWEASGVPEMIPVDGSSVRPLGNGGEIDQVLTVPVTVGVSGVIVWLVLRDNVLAEYEIVGGAAVTPAALILTRKTWLLPADERVSVPVPGAKSTG